MPESHPQNEDFLSPQLASGVHTLVMFVAEKFPEFIEWLQGEYEKYEGATVPTSEEIGLAFSRLHMEVDIAAWGLPVSTEILDTPPTDMI